MQGLETKLDEWLVKKAPFQIPENGRQGLVKALPILTLLGGVLMLWAAWGLYSILANPFVQLAYSLGYNTGGYGAIVWVSLALLVVEALLFFIAYPGLREHKKSGWNILYYVTLLNVAEAILQVIGYSGVGNLIASLIGSVIGLYLLFQVRSYYTGQAPAATGGHTPKPAEKPVGTPPASSGAEKK